MAARSDTPDPGLPPIVLAGHPVLRSPALPVSPDQLGTRELRALAEVMAEVMHEAPGVGLAAPQIAVPLQLIVLEEAQANLATLSAEDRDARGRVVFPLTTIVNPVLRPIGERRVTFVEGCLSVPGYAAQVERFHEVEVTGLDLSGKPIRWQVSGWPARILQHEVDHVNGILYIDRMISRTFMSTGFESDSEDLEGEAEA
jgi:peptide deformylase